MRRKDELIGTLQQQLEDSTRKLQQQREYGEFEIRENQLAAGRGADYWTGRPLESNRSTSGQPIGDNSSNSSIEQAAKIVELQRAITELRQALTAEEEAHAATR